MLRWVAVAFSLSVTVALAGAAPLAGQIVIPPLPPQTVGTECWNSGGVVRCNSQVGLLYTPPPNPALGQAFSNLAQVLAARRALQAQQAALAQAQAAAEREQAAEMAAAAARDSAAFRLYVDRVRDVLTQVEDSLRIYGEGARRLHTAVAPSLNDLYTVSPMATHDQIIEVLRPQLRALDQQFSDFLVRVVPLSKPAVDSLGLAQDELQLLVRALLPVSQDAFMTNPDATPAEYRSAINPMLQRARVYFDSTRAARIPITKERVQPIVDSVMAEALLAPGADRSRYLPMALDTVRALRARSARLRLKALCDRVGCLSIYAAHGVQTTLP